MAIVIAPAMSMQASGNVGSINFTRWKGVNVARTTYVYTDPNTGKQQSQRGKLEYLAIAWGVLLSAANRQTWNNRAAEVVFKNRLGGEYQPSGYQVFMKWNLQLAVIGDAHNYDAPVGIVSQLIDKLYIAGADPGKVIYKLVDFTGNNITCRAAVYFRAGPFTSGGRRPIMPEYRLQKVSKPPTSVADTGLDVNNYYWYKGFGVLVNGQRTNAFESQIKVPS